MRRTTLTAGLTTALAALLTAALHQADLLGAKPNPTPNWLCAITFADREGDLIGSDGRGTYTNGVDKVTCEIYPNDTGALHDNLHFQPQSRSDRRFVVAGASVRQPDYFEVWRLRSADYLGNVPDAEYLRAFRVTTDEATKAYRGDSFASGTLWDSSSSVFVTPITACSWEIESRPAPVAPLYVDANGLISGAGTIELAANPRSFGLITGIPRTPVFAGFHELPFKARVDVIGNKAGCPLP